MKQIQITGQEADDDEIAAAIAAVYLACSLEGEQDAAEPEKEKKLSKWGQQARLEAVGLGNKLGTLEKKTGWMFLIAGLAMLAPEALALERIQPYSSETFPASSPKTPLKMRICLGSFENSAELCIPDGAEIYDEQSNKLLAVLPAQSRWQINLKEQGSLKSVEFDGTAGSVSSRKLIIASRSNSKIQPASYHGSGHFAQVPQVKDAISGSKFSLTMPADQCSIEESPAVKPAAFSSPNGALARPPKLVGKGFRIKAPSQEGLLSYQGKTFRGELALRPRIDGKKSLLVINNVELEDYLLSVVPSEMPSSWKLESLKAQAIAARSYAVANIGKHASESYDLKSNTEDQVYLGVQTESENGNRAVAETSNLVLTHNGNVVTAFFHSSGGGHTELAEYVWKRGVPYLKAVPDFDDNSPHFAWNRQIPVATVEETLRKQGKDLGALLGIFPLSRSASQRLQSALLAGTLQSLIVSGEELRRILQLPSTVFNIGQTTDAYLLAGRGFGHGLGMSQWGAKYLSEQGYNAAQILTYYYKDVAIEHIPNAILKPTPN